VVKQIACTDELRILQVEVVKYFKGFSLGSVRAPMERLVRRTPYTIKAEAQPGVVRITGSKDYAELVNIYMRVVGTAAWTLVGIKRKKFPFEDQTPLKSAGMAEAREYAARGVIDDNEVGQMSDIVQVAFAG
jgi:hypothetical protein